MFLLEALHNSALQWLGILFLCLPPSTPTKYLVTSPVLLRVLKERHLFDRMIARGWSAEMVRGDDGYPVPGEDKGSGLLRRER